MTLCREEIEESWKIIERLNEEIEELKMRLEGMESTEEQRRDSLLDKDT